MNYSYKQIVRLLSEQGNHKLLKNSEHALERETLRVDQKAKISTQEHPAVFGSPMSNPYISTDFAEPQLELITPIYKTEQGPLNFLTEIHSFVAQNLPKDEMLWPSSMPALLPKDHEDIPLARYGTSFLGQKRTRYRAGLSQRYGRKMQTISGIHYNFSFSQKFWDFLYKKFAPKSQSRRDFVDQAYFRMIRNFLEISWMDTYLFGCSPAVDRSYLDSKPFNLRTLDRNTYYAPYATSLRMSKYGYCCSKQTKLDVSFKTLQTYVHDLKQAINTPFKKYKNAGLNDNVLQIPNEYYAVIRPKQPTRPTESLLDKLLSEGVKYVEVRTVDLDPFSPIGTDVKHLQFLHVMMLYCLFKEPQYQTAFSQKRNMENQALVAFQGRKPGLKLSQRGRKITLTSWANQMLEEMTDAAALLDKNHKDQRYSKVLQEQFAKVSDPDCTPSAHVLEQLQVQSFRQFGLERACEHFKYFNKHKVSKANLQRFQLATKKSICEKQQLELQNEKQTEGYEDLEYSTQILIKEAQNRGITIDVLDRKNNLIRLSKGRHSQLVKQATITHLDSQLTHFIMGDKMVTKQLLQEVGLQVPPAKQYYDSKAAMADFQEHADHHLVIKPTTANYGISINFIQPHDRSAYQRAVRQSFMHDDSIIIEHFATGDEYRFLVIDGKCIGVLKRVPANITGDGKNTIERLISRKNYFRLYPGLITLGKTEMASLKAQNLTAKSVLAAGRQVFLRQNSNISTGGDAIAFTKAMPSRFKKVAILAAKAAQARICGVDMIIPNLKAKSYSIIELNYNPVLKPHHFPHQGKPINAATKVLDLLGF